MTISKIKNNFFNHMGYGAINPIRDWLFLVALSAILLAGIVVWNVWAFDAVAQGGIIGKPDTNAPSSINQSSVDQINTIFANRAAEENKYVNGAYQYTDPSQ